MTNKIFTTEQSSSVGSQRFARFRANRVAYGGLIIVITFVMAAIFGPLLSPYDPATVQLDDLSRYMPPTLAHPFGTDAFGRDVMSRIFYGSRISLFIGFAAMLLSTVLGTAIGASAAYFGGRTDGILMRIADIIMAFPMFFLLLLLVGMFDSGVLALVIMMGVSSWMGVARLVRAEILSLKSHDTIEAAHAIGLPAWRIIFYHLIPRVASPLLVASAFSVGGMIGAEAGLSFLGFGIQPPTPSWGSMISEGQDLINVAWWMIFFPGLFLTLTLVSFALIADGIRDAFDVKPMPWKRQ